MPSTQTQEIQLDDEVLDQVITLLNSVADTLDEQADDAIEIAESMVDELKINGSVPPIYTDIGDALRAVARKMKNINNEVVAKLRADAKILKNQIEQQAEVQSSGAAAVNSLDTSMAV